MSKTKRQPLNNTKLMTNYDIIHDNWFYDNIFYTDWADPKIENIFNLNTYGEIQVYERKNMNNKKDKPEELIRVLDYFSKRHGYDGEFSFKDFEALMPTSLERIKNEENKDIWIPLYGDLRYSYKTGYLNCCCSKDCGSLYLIKNIKTNKYFGVGSVCINKFIDGEFQKHIIKLKKEVLCKVCSCCKNEFNKNKLNKILNKQYCNKCIKTITITLNIKYDEKDKYRKYGTKWDKDNKTWYINGCNYHKDLNEKIDDLQFEEKIDFIEDSDEDDQ